MVLAERVAAGYHLPLPSLRVQVVPHAISNVTKAVAAEMMARFQTSVKEAIFAKLEDNIASTVAQADVLMGAALQHIEHDGDEETAAELYRSRGWLDGLPIVLPTAARVERMLGALAPQRLRVFGHVAPKGAVLTLESLAVNAVMAGCAPAYFPAVVAAARSVLDPRFNLLTTSTTTNAASPLFIACGPIAGQIGIQGGNDLLGSYHRANITIGRAIRLVMIAVGEARPNDGDMATQGHGAKVGVCITESESPWEPLHVELGCDASESAIVALSACAQFNILDFGSRNADDLLDTVARTMAVPGLQNAQTSGGPIILFGIEHARILANAGLSKADVKRRLFEQARIPISSFGRDTVEDIIKVRRPQWGLAERNPSRMIPVADEIDEITILVGGGEGQHSVLMPTFHTPRPVLAKVGKDGLGG